MTSSPSLVSALQPPAGVTPNFANPHSLAKWDILCVSLCLALTSIVFSLRTYVRLYIKRQWVLEDCAFYSSIMPDTRSWSDTGTSVVAFVRTTLYFQEIYTDLAFHKIGLVVLIAITATTIHKHGGVHEWDLTLPEVHQAIYVSNTSLMVWFLLLHEELSHNQGQVKLNFTNCG